MNSFISAGFTTLLVVFAVAAFLLWPFVTIWSLNTLFALGIPYTFWTWLSALVLLMVIGVSKVSTK